MLSMMVMSSAEPDETTGGIIFTVLAVSLRPVFSLSDTSIQMNPRRLWGRRGFKVENLRRGPKGQSTDRRCFSSNCRRGGLAGYPVKTAGSFLSTVSLSLPAVTSGACKLLGYYRMAYNTYVYIIIIIIIFFAYLT